VIGGASTGGVRERERARERERERERERDTIFLKINKGHEVMG
jgi:hypothetical protein